ncbi:type II toxin-antitoxin system RatA family toxin [Flavivirga spongiicola]|uniref:SRPBCC family protein n=1 Tax=Flavivirga spongiicola TaxID=421621 RepID=A0ABU7XMX6_9FLAO|nr:SRPBCC family protein [Flavivirga sp. MEBiC05379]MDO5981457.1 SRPBCC family protein [Flavivirga sp. MEBiC05379]MDO5981898.1 SRPBCC family protein [Flavivirga sp. MEBiC05379]
MSFLQITLLCNAIFSFATGISLILFFNTIATWFGKQTPTVFWIIGLGLLYFSYSIGIEIRNPKPHAVFYIIVQDFIWVLASLAIVIIKPFNISVIGYQIITIVMFLVLFFGIGQTIGLAQVDTLNNKGLKHLTYERIINATKENTWKVISDVSNYHKVAPNIDSVTIISGEDKGMIRSCSHKTNSWTEVAILWEAGEQYTFQVNTDAEDYPYPLKSLKGTWKVQAVSEHETKIIMQFDFIYKQKIYNVLIHPFMKKKFNKICDELLDNWENILEVK